MRNSLERSPTIIRTLSRTPFATVTLTILLLAVIVGLAALLVWQNYTATLRAAEVRAQSSAHVVAAHVEWIVEASDQALRRIDSALGDGPIRSSADAIVDISQAVGDLPPGFQYSVYDETGALRLSSIPEAVGINVADREYFKELRDGAEIVISPQLDERLSGRSVFVIARRISRNLTFHGAASIAIPTETMDRFWSSMALGPHSSVSVIRTDGALVARHPQLKQSINLSETPLFTTYLPSSPSGFYHNAISPADGLARIVGYWKVAGWPLVATTGVERGEALEFFWTGLRSELAFGIPAMLMLVSGSFWITRLLREDATRRNELEAALEQNKLLFREIHHRVKNNLQVVSSLMQLQPLSKEARSDMARRIAAMVAVHEQIYGGDQFDRVELAPYITRLVNEIASTYDKNVEVEVDIQPLSVARDQALPIGLIVNEVVSNVFKHAFADGRRGHLLVALTAQEDEGSLSVTDNGIGYEPEGKLTGMGSKLIEGFVAQVGGQFAFRRGDGTIFTMTFPLY